MEDDQQARSEGARAMGRVRSERKTEAGRENALKARQARWADPAARERQAEAIREAARLRREAKEAGSRPPDVIMPADTEPETPKRDVSDVHSPTETGETPENGTQTI